MAVFLYILYFVNKDISVRIAGTMAIGILCIMWFAIEYRLRKQEVLQYNSNIKKLILMDGDGSREKEWYFEGAVSFLIGKSTPTTEVDIELGDTRYSEYISNEHAVMNYSNGFWYIEDLESLNGVGLKKKGEQFVFRLKPFTPYKVDKGDIIYISKAKLLVR
ncbi:FHA domain-containing protein [Defluviitalea phaphyphila]|uniref:FHA domain-containing protein n=1 Tax=Defluviitalea phaphyphila TaxID=1473580 RepID=UPI0007304062|nr:FHA domain-containing protein [Defluviitalea phaphyphila]